MAFQFRFKALLRYKEHLLTKAQRDLAAAVQEFETTRRRLEEMKEEQKQRFFELESKKKAGIRVAEYQLFFSYLTYLEQQLLKIEAELSSLGEGVDKAREALLNRQKETKVLEILRDRDKLEYNKALAKKDLKQLDDKATMTCFYTNVTSESREMTDGAT